MNLLFSLVLFLHTATATGKATATTSPVITSTPDSASSCDAPNHAACTAQPAATVTAAHPAIPDADPKVIDASLSVAIRACTKHPDATAQLDQNGEWFEAPCSNVLAVLQQHPNHHDFFDKTQELIDEMSQAVTNAVKSSEQHADSPTPACKVSPAGVGSR